jgi:hypothetical protein
VLKNEMLMRVLSILLKGLKAMVDEASMPEAARKGRDFEEYVLRHIFIERYYEVLHQTPGYLEAKRRYNHAASYPDFQFRDKLRRIDFYVEAKFRAPYLHEEKIIWCREDQLQRYTQISRQTPVFLILGIGDFPQKPEILSLIPLKAIRFTGLYPSFIRKYEISPRFPVTSDTLWSRW